MAKNRKDALKLLKEDHDRVRELLEKLDDTTSRGIKTRRQLLEEIAAELKVHTQLEEEIFYPAFREAAKKNDDEELYWEALEEHALVEEFELPRIEGADPSTEAFGAKAGVLKELVLHHAREEEKEMFPRAKKLMSKDELEALGERIEQRKEQLKRQRKAA